MSSDSVDTVSTNRSVSRSRSRSRSHTPLKGTQSDHSQSPTEKKRHSQNGAVRSSQHERQLSKQRRSHRNYSPDGLRSRNRDHAPANTMHGERGMKWASRRPSTDHDGHQPRSPHTDRTLSRRHRSRSPAKHWTAEPRRRSRSSSGVHDRRRQHRPSSMSREKPSSRGVKQPSSETRLPSLRDRSLSPYSKRLALSRA